MKDGKDINWVDNKYGQRVFPGSRVAYVSNWEMTLPETHNGATTFGIKHGVLTVGTVKRVVRATFITDPITELYLEDGTIVDADDAVKLCE